MTFYIPLTVLYALGALPASYALYRAVRWTLGRIKRRRWVQLDRTRPYKRVDGELRWALKREGYDDLPLGHVRREELRQRLG